MVFRFNCFGVSSFDEYVNVNIDHIPDLFAKNGCCKSATSVVSTKRNKLYLTAYW